MMHARASLQELPLESSVKSERELVLDTRSDGPAPGERHQYRFDPAKEVAAVDVKDAHQAAAR